MTKPTYHYDKHGRMIHASDYVKCDTGEEGRVEWDSTNKRWVLLDERTEGEYTELNFFSAKELEIREPMPRRAICRS